jgi:CheY-like chemotaxis protein
MVTMFIQDTLADIGCEVAGVASRLNEALEKARTLAFDVAILDVNLDGEQTFPIAEALLARGMPFVFATGYSATSLPATLQRAPILQKPFRQSDLEQALRAALQK